MRKTLCSALALTAMLVALLALPALARRWESSWPYDHTPAWEYRPAVDNYPFTGWDHPYPYANYGHTYLNNFGFPLLNDVHGCYGVRKYTFGWY